MSACLQELAAARARKKYRGIYSMCSAHPWVLEAAMRRAVRFGDGWHPIRFRMDWLRNQGLPTLRRIAAEEGRPVPALCPRINVGLAVPLDQVLADLEALAALGATHVLLDTYSGRPQDTAVPEKDWSRLAAIAERVSRQ